MSLNILHIFTSVYANVIEIIQDSEPLPENQELGPILEPDPIQFSFNTPGWYFLGIVLLSVFLIGLFKWIQYYRKNAYRRQAVKRLDLLNSNKGVNDIAQQVSEVLVVLKRVAIQTYGRKEVASLSGRPWFLFLDSKVKTNSFREYEPLISELIYQGMPLSENKLVAFKNLSKIWIRKHA